MEPAEIPGTGLFSELPWADGTRSTEQGLKEDTEYLHF